MAEWRFCCKFAPMITTRLFTLAAVCAVAVTAVAQDFVPLKVDFDRRVAPLMKPSQPTWSTPVLPNSTLPESPKLDLGESFADTLALWNNANMSHDAQPNRSHYYFRMDPYSNNYSRGGVIAMGGGGYLMGASSYSAMPALGNVGSASLHWVQPLGERLVVAAGASGEKYHFDRDAWNAYAVSAAVRFHFTDRLSLNAWGNYAFNQRFHSMAAMPYIGTSEYGGSLSMQMSQRFGMELGVRRYYDTYTGQWRTVPVIAPSLNIFGAPISVDLGGLVMSIIEGALKKDKYSNSPVKIGVGDGPSPMQMKSVDAGFNPHSPVRIPDALRHR